MVETLSKAGGRWFLVAIIILSGGLFWLLMATAGQAQGNIENFDDPALPNWAVSPAGSVIWSSTDSEGDPASGSAEWVFNGRLRRYYLLSPAGHYQIRFKWLWDNTYFAVRVIDASNDQVIYERDSNSLTCENEGAIWDVGAWNDCLVIPQIPASGVYWLEFEASSGSVDAIWEPQFSIVGGGGGGTGTPSPSPTGTITATVTPTPTTTPTATPTPTGTTPSYYLVPIEAGDITYFTPAPPGPEPSGTHNCSYYEGTNGLTVECDGQTNSTGAYGRFVGGLQGWGSNDLPCTLTRGMYANLASSPADNGSHLDVSEFSLNRAQGIGWQEIPSGSAICALLIGDLAAEPIVGCEYTWIFGSFGGDWIVNQFVGGTLPNGDNANYSFVTNEWAWIVEEGSTCAYTPPTPTPPPTPPPTPVFTDTCTFTGTQTITNPQGITSTIPYSYSVPSNLVANYSFEEGSGSHPYDWLPTVNGATNYDVPPYWWPQSARTGSYAVNSASNFDLYGDLPLFDSGTYLVGMYAKCSGGGCPEVTALLAGGSPIATTSNLTDTYKVFSDTWVTGGGSTWLIVDFAQAGGTWVDDVFVYPVTDDGFGNYELNCSPEFYPEPPGTPDDTTPGPISPIPVGGAGTVCYLCTSPDRATPDFVSHWIAWLGCVLRNMFSCSLRVWLLVIGNWLKGLVEMGLAWLDWIPATTQAAVLWAVSLMESGSAWLNNALSGISIIYQEGTNFLDLLIAIIELVALLVQTISQLLLGIMDMVIDLIAVIPSAFDGAPSVFSVDGQTEIIKYELEDPGPNTSKIMWLILTPIGVLDSIIVPRLSELFVVGLAALGFGLILWVINWWQDFEI